jgi:hypothetical protein
VAALVVLHEGADGDRVRRWFAEQGFAVGPLVGISFSIEAPRPLMERHFADYHGAAEGGGELQLDALPEEPRAAVRAVAVEAPPEFGPGNP